MSISPYRCKYCNADLVSCAELTLDTQHQNSHITYIASPFNWHTDEAPGLRISAGAFYFFLDKNCHFAYIVINLG